MMSRLSSLWRKTKLSQATVKSQRHQCRSKISASLVAGTEQGSFFRMRPCFKIPVSSTNTAAPAKCVSFHAEMVPCPFYITYRFIAHSWVIPRGHQAREQYLETDSFELGLPSSDSDSISLMPHIYQLHGIYISSVCVYIQLVYTRDIKQKGLDLMLLCPFQFAALEDLFSIYRELHHTA